MTCRKVGSQMREPIEDTGLVIEKTWPAVAAGSVVLMDPLTGKRELWQLNDHFCGYVIEINGRGYEFVRTLKEGV